MSSLNPIRCASTRTSAAGSRHKRIVLPKTSLVSSGVRFTIVNGLVTPSSKGVAAATILGDGRVALILDVDAVIAARTRDRFEPQPLAQAS